MVTLGWVFGQYVCLRKTLYDRPKHEHRSDTQISHLLDKVRKIQPRQVLAKTYCDSSKEDESFSSASENESIFGPPTIEEVRMLLCRQDIL